MDQPRQGVVGLTHEDRLFLQRARAHLRTSFVAGWFLIVLSVFSGLIVAANFNRLFSEFIGIRLSAAEQLHAENDRLRALHTTTSLEQGLVDGLIEKNRIIETLFRVSFVSAVVVVVGVLGGGLLSEGLRLLAFARERRRYLRIIEAMERSLGLSQG